MVNLIGLSGAKARLIPLDFELHFENTLVWLSDPEITRYLSQNLPITRLREEAYFRKMMESPNDAIWAIVDLEGKHIGNTTIQSINWKERFAGSAMIIGEKSTWGHGYASDSHLIKLKYAFEELGLNRVETDVFVDNVGACRVCEKVGWLREGIARKKFFRRGKWHDVVHYAFLAEDYYRTISAGVEASS